MSHARLGIEEGLCPSLAFPREREFLHTREALPRPEGHHHPHWNKFPTFRTPGGVFPGDLKAKPSKDLLEAGRRKNQKDVKKRQ